MTMQKLTTPWATVRPDDDGIRPAGAPNRCFYCHAKVGHPHGPQCVCVLKKVRYIVAYRGRHVGAFILYEPWSWDKRMCLWARNSGSWCKNNALESIEWTDLHAEEGIAKWLDEDDNRCCCDQLEFINPTVLDEGPFIRLREPESKEATDHVE